MERKEFKEWLKEAGLRRGLAQLLELANTLQSNLSRCNSVKTRLTTCRKGGQLYGMMIFFGILSSGKSDLTMGGSRPLRGENNDQEGREKEEDYAR